MAERDLIQYLEREEAREESNLRDSCRHLAKRLARLADAQQIRPNELGVMQAEGSFIDSRAGALQRIRDDLAAARGFLPDHPEEKP